VVHAAGWSLIKNNQPKVLGSGVTCWNSEAGRNVVESPPSPSSTAAPPINLPAGAVHLHALPVYLEANDDMVALDPALIVAVVLSEQDWVTETVSP